MDATSQRQSPAIEPRTQLIGAAVRTWLRYLVPLTLLSAIALSPVIAIALGTRAPVDAAAAKAVRVRAWEMLALAVFCQLVLVGGAAAITRGAPTQLRALTGGVRQLIHAIVPCIAAAAAIAIGGLALAVPGLLLLVLLSLTGASPERGVRARLVDSIAVSRARLPTTALTVLAMLALDAAIGLVAYRLFGAPLPKRPTAAQLAMSRDLVHAIAVALVIASPLPATILATIRNRTPP